MAEDVPVDARGLAASLNNETWTALDERRADPGSDAATRELLLYRAYAAAYFWRLAGGPAQHARAEHLLARAAAAVGEDGAALRHARRCLALVEGADPADVEDWDLALALEALARAEQLNGLPDARVTRDRARRACAAVADEEDCAVVERELASAHWPRH